MSPTEPAPDSPRKVVRSRWLRILACWAVLTAPLMVAVYLFIHPIYQSVCLIRVDPTKPGLFDLKSGESVEQFMQTQVQLMTSSNILTAAATNPAVSRLARIQNAGDVVLELRKVIQVSPRPGTYLIEVAMNSESPNEAALFVNAVVDAYMESNNEWSDGMTRIQIRNLETYLADLKSQAEEYERRWKDLAKQQDSQNDVARKGPISPELIRRIEEKLAENEIKRIEIQSRLEFYRGGQVVPPPGSIAQFEQEIQGLDVLEKNLKERLGANLAKARNEGAIDVDIALAKENRESLKEMMEAVKHRLEQLKFDAKGEARVRPLSQATPAGRPIKDYRLRAMVSIPFATLFLVIGLFTTGKAWSGRSGRLSPPKPSA